MLIYASPEREREGKGNGKKKEAAASANTKFAALAEGSAGLGVIL